MNKILLLYIAALTLFSVPLYLFRKDIFSGFERKTSSVRKSLERKEKVSSGADAVPLQKNPATRPPLSSSTSILLSKLPPSSGGMAEGEISIDTRRNTLVRAIEKALPGVVNIGTERLNRRNFLLFGDHFQALFEDFLRTQENTKTFSLGSGFVIDKSGLIVTNAHVVDRASRIHVTLSGGFSGKAEVIAFDSANDIALLHLQKSPPSLPCSTLDFSGKLFLGETVIAAGNPFGLGSSISAGVLSGTKRSFTYGGRVIFSDILQTDAIVYPGNSGGPLININGEVIGMNVSLYKNAPGIGFAIPVQRVLEHLTGWMVPERVNNLSLGLVPGIRTGRDGKMEIFIRNVIPHTPAAASGIKKGDRIIRIDGENIRDPLQLNRKLVTLKNGKKIRLETAGGFSCVLAPRKFKISDTLARTEKLLGLKLVPVDEEIAEKLLLPVKSGLLVSGFGSPPISLPPQICRGDLLVMLNGKRIVNEKDLFQVINGGKFGEDMTAVFLTPASARGRNEPEQTQSEKPAMLQYRVRLRMQ